MTSSKTSSNSVGISPLKMNLSTSENSVLQASTDTKISVKSESSNNEVFNINQSIPIRQYRNKNLLNSSIQDKTSFKSFACISNIPIDFQAPCALQPKASTKLDNELMNGGEPVLYRTDSAVRQYRNKKKIQSVSEDKSLAAQAGNTLKNDYENFKYNHSLVNVTRHNVMSIKKNNIKTTSPIDLPQNPEEVYVSPFHKHFGTFMEIKDDIKSHIEHIFIPDPSCVLAKIKIYDDKESLLVSRKGTKAIECQKIMSEYRLIRFNKTFNNLQDPNNRLNQTHDYHDLKSKNESAKGNGESGSRCINTELASQDITKNYNKKTEEEQNSTDFMCKICCLKFLTKTSLRDHHNLTHKPFQCENCDKRFMQSTSFEYHLKFNKCKKKCDSCNKVFKQPSYLKIHLKNKACVKRNKCKICGDSILSQREAQEHKKTHENEKRFSCTQCSKSFKDKYRLKTHIYVHNKEKNFSCSDCEKKFVSPHHLKMHKRCVHPDSPKHQCTICNKMFKVRQALTNHLKLHSKSFMFVCYICGKGFRQRSSLRCHELRHGEKSLKCSICSKKFFKNTSLKNHMRIHTGEKPFKCSLCNRSFSLSNNMMRHMQLHSTEKQFQCHVCDKRFYQKQSLNVHLKTHERFPLKSHIERQCSVCRVYIEDLNCSFSVHMLEHKQKGEVSLRNSTQCQKKYYKANQCHICGKLLFSRNYLQQHLYSHGSEKRYKCSICNVGFKLKQNLTRHKYLHTSKQFLCYICGKTFSQQMGLNLHIRTHKGEKPHQCIICKRDFLDVRSLKRHLKLHSEQRLYECADCGQSFYHKISLINHIQLKHQIQ